MLTKTSHLLPGILLLASVLVGCGSLESTEPPLDRAAAFDNTPAPEPQSEQPGTTREGTKKRRLRITFMVDTSQSMAVVDPPVAPSARERAVTEVMLALSARSQGKLLPRFHEEVRYGFIAFNDEPPVVNGGLAWGFLDDLKMISQSMTFFSETRGTADHQGALQSCQKLIEHDLGDPTSTDAALARTTHNIILVTDGAPSIVCKEGCNDDGEHPACDKAEDPCTDCYPAIPPCAAYNTPQSLQELAATISSLSDKARIRLHVVLMAHHLPAFARDQARNLWAGVAAAGKGAYIEATDLSEMSFIDPLGLDDDGQPPPPIEELRCKNPQDHALLDTEQQRAGVSDATKAAVLACLAAASDDPAVIEPCANAMAIEDTGLSPGCAGCYVEGIICVIDSCLPACVDLDSPECTKCRKNAMCDETFGSCSGLTTPLL